MAIIISRNGKDAQKIRPTDVREEDYLQKYIAENPDVLPLDETNGDAKLLVIGREFDTDSGPIDVLAVDRNGEIFIIETKLFKNPDKRRVVAQMLDYGAALWTAYGSGDQFLVEINNAISRSGAGGLDERLKATYNLSDDQVAEVRNSIRRNLAQGEIKFVVLMDQLHERLRDLIMFINQKSNFNIYAVEMEFYEHAGMEIVIPKLFGAEVKKDVVSGGAASKPRKDWTQETFDAELRSQTGDEDAVQVARQMVAWFTEPNKGRIKSGRGGSGALYAMVEISGKEIEILTLWDSGDIQLWIKNIEDEITRAELRRRISAIPGIVLSKALKEPEIEGGTKPLANPETWRRFTDVMKWLVSNPVSK